MHKDYESCRVGNLNGAESESFPSDLAMPNAT